MANHCFPNLVGAMDRLWFHHIIFLSEPMTILSPKTTKPMSETPLISLSSPNLCDSTPSEDEISSASSPTTTQDDFYNEEEELRPTRLNLSTTTKIRSQSSSPSVKKIPNRRRYSGSVSGEGRRLRKTKSCKSLWELEYEELKGFSDLGFKFKKELVTPRMMSVIPGLQRLEEYEGREEHRCADEAPKDDEIEVDREEDEEEEQRGVMRPYLSEAWLIKRPDSPLLNLKIPRASAADDMKKHLRFWARTVAAVIQQES
ncbi:uncharacterized protein LOC122641446 [Telopea speciosissima]|uniref:uncharacterized protein LOC122641446 n=1 Tax=Telopea speciosissima TaxID=54955 RepID=UPI001CC7DEAF|nr:uncharacterized protein LOC122641446 [Telopea speciosissima]